MAGFDIEIDASSSDRPFLHSLFRLAQRLANLRGLKLQYRWSSDGGYYSTVDGSLVSMQAFLDPLVVGLLSYARGATEYGSASYRRALALRLTTGYAEGLDGISQTVEGISEIFGVTPISISFNVGSATHLKGHLDGFTSALSLYHQGRIKPYQIAEDAHTAIELLMREVLGPGSKRQSFAEMVHITVDKRYLEPHLVSPMIHLKDHRKGAKHKGQGISYPVINKLLPLIIEASHRLTRIIRLAHDP